MRGDGGGALHEEDVPVVEAAKGGGWTVRVVGGKPKPETRNRKQGGN